MTRIFLSYTGSDSAIAQQVAAKLRDTAGVEVFYYTDDQRRGQNFVRKIEAALQEADLFVALMSPAYMDSQWCTQERDLALVRQTDLGRQFVYVFQVATTAHADTGFMRTIDWVDLLPPVDDARLARAVAALTVAQERPAAVSEVNGLPQATFHNRYDEIGKIINTLTTAGGSEFWLVLAPPRMGKSWFLGRVAFELKKFQPECQSYLVDLRAHPVELRSNWVALLCELLAVDVPDAEELSQQQLIRKIATDVTRRACSQLFLLDSAELIEVECVEHFRSALTSVYRLVERSGNDKSRLSVMVGSRHQRAWKGFGRAGSKVFQTVQLPEFGVPVVRKAVVDLGRKFGAGQLNEWANALHSLSEGLPALLVEGLRWAMESEFLAIEDCDDESAFTAVARPYIAGDLLTSESLLPFEDVGSAARKAVLERALEVITPYRLFTQSHLKYHVGDDPGFGQELAEADWTLDELWEALARTALLKQPSEEIWEVLNPPIRRLLYRYYYPDTPVRLRAHEAARRFYGSLAASVASGDQCVVLVECLWHEAARLWHLRPEELPTSFKARAVELTRELVHPDVYSRTELARFVTDRMLDDSEFATLLSSSDFLFEEIVDLVGATITGGA
jgi:TIR domain